VRVRVQDKGSGAAECVSLWRAVPPAGYCALGCVAVASYVSKPVIEQFRCVHASVVAPSVYSHCAWTDALSGAASPVSVWAVSNAARTFVASTSYARPNAALALSLGRGEARPDVASPSVLAWLIQLFVELEREVGPRTSFAALRPRLFRGELVCGLLQLVKTVKQRMKVGFIRQLASVVLRAGDASVLCPWARSELARLRDVMEHMHTRQAREGRGFSSVLQALVELFSSVAVLCGRLGCTEAEAAQPDHSRGLCTEEWFERLVEGVRVMQALSNRSRLPDSFLVAEDAFARLIAMDEAVVVESQHPYFPRSVMSGCVLVPGALRLLLKFDARCSVDASQALLLKPTEASRDVLGAYSSEFGSYARALTVEGGCVYYNFPGAMPPSTWTFEGDTHGAFKLSDARRTATVTKNKA
jgi:hypothetical protein